MCMKGAIGLINSLHENVHIRGCIDAYWPNCVSKKKGHNPAELGWCANLPAVEAR